MNYMTRQLAEALRVVLIRAEEEYQSLLELGRDDEDTAEEAVLCGEELAHARAVLGSYDNPSIAVGV